MILYGDGLDVSRLPGNLRRFIGGEVVPRLIANLHGVGLEAYSSHRLEVISEVHELVQPKPRLFEIANPTFQPTASPQDTTVVVLKRGDELVGVVGARLKWVEKSLKHSLETGSLIIEGESSGKKIMHVESPAAQEIQSCNVAVTTGLALVNPGKDKGAFKALIRLLHLQVLVEWRWSYLVALAPDHIAKQYSLDVEGFSRIETGVMWNRDGLWTPYRLVVAHRPWWRQLVSDNRFADLSIPLGLPKVQE